MQSDFCKQNQLAYKMNLVFYAYNKKAVSKKPFETAMITAVPLKLHI